MFLFLVRVVFIMVKKNIVVVLGPAGCGKTSLVASLGKWIEKNQFMKPGYVNLDPGAVFTPYVADVDIRSYVRAEEVMTRERLGPNGALIRSIEIAMGNLDDIVAKIASLKNPYILVDTPGQMELFLFRDFGVEFVEKMKKYDYVMGIVIFDPTLASRPQDILSLKLLATIAQLRLGIDTIPVVNKGDLGREKLEIMQKLLTSPEQLADEVKRVEGLLGEISEKMIQILEEYRFATRIPIVSSLTWEGLEKLYDMIHEIFCTCGDLT